MHSFSRSPLCALALLALGSCADAPRATTCADRTGGALVTFDIVGQTFRVWVTDGPFIDEALAQLGGAGARVPIFGTLVAGSDVCEPSYGFHVDPADVSFADAAIELCDGTPMYVDENFASWQTSVGTYCPWSANVVAVDDRRAP